jgi:hypothetical protein
LTLPGDLLAEVQLGDYRVQLEDDQGQPYDLGVLTLGAAGSEGYSYRLVLQDAQFEDHFLSMRPFKCLRHPAQLVCHLPYPYPLRRTITNTDLVDLEYDLLFVHKTPQEYGIDAWNGLYFKLRTQDNGFVGELYETDLNVLQSPPEDEESRPIDPDELHEASDKHWPKRIVIRKISAGGEDP